MALSSLSLGLASQGLGCRVQFWAFKLRGSCRAWRMLKSGSSCKVGRV